MSTTTRNAVLLLALLAVAGVASPYGNLSDINHWAWSENAGWLSCKATHGGVTVHLTHLSGYAWAENVGWVKLGCDAGGPYANTSASNWGVNRDASDQLSGYGWSENAGWVNFDPTHGGVTVDPLTGDLSGFAWSENLGFVHLANPSPAYKVQLVVPQLPSTLTGDPEPGIWSNDSTVTAEWSGATGNDLGLGYSFLFDIMTSTEPDTTIDLEHTVDPHSTTESLPDGSSWWFHLASCDPVGNCSPAAHLGPFMLDATPPQVALVHTVRDTGDGQLLPGEQTWAAVTQLYVSLDEVALDAGSGSLPDDVSNPANWRLVGAGADGVVETVSCSGLAGDDLALAIDQVSWDEPTTTARLKVNGGVDLPRGRYRVLACGSTSIVDRAGNPLDGDGDGVGGDDFWQELSVSDTDLLANPNLDETITGWDRSSVSEIAWGIDDAGQAPTSGSVAMTNLTGVGHELSVSQCVAVDDLQGHWAAGRAWLDSGLGGAPSASAEVTWYAASGCAGAVLGSGTSVAAVGDTGTSWEPFAGWLATPAGALSAEVRFVLAAGASDDCVANLDDLLLLEMLWGDGFETGDTSGWSGAVP